MQFKQPIIKLINKIKKKLNISKHTKDITTTSVTSNPFKTLPMEITVEILKHLKEKNGSIDQYYEELLNVRQVCKNFKTLVEKPELDPFYKPALANKNKIDTNQFGLLKYLQFRKGGKQQLQVHQLLQFIYSFEIKKLKKFLKENPEVINVTPILHDLIVHHKYFANINANDRIAYTIHMETHFKSPSYLAFAYLQITALLIQCGADINMPYPSKDNDHYRKERMFYYAKHTFSKYHQLDNYHDNFINLDPRFVANSKNEMSKLEGLTPKEIGLVFNQTRDMRQLFISNDHAAGKKQKKYG